MTVSILLATYNGADYLPEQLNSLLAQTHTDWRLLVRDDGSTDSTTEILQAYAENDARIEVLHEKGDGKGALSNFQRLLEIAHGRDEPLIRTMSGSRTNSRSNMTPIRR